VNILLDVRASPARSLIGAKLGYDGFSVAGSVGADAASAFRLVNPGWLWDKRVGS